MFNPTASKRYHPRLAVATRALLKNLCENPDNLYGHIRHQAASVILSIAYGIEILPENDPHVSLAEEAVRLITAAVLPGANLVENIPLLRYVPEWFPGWKRRAREAGRVTTAMIVKPFETATAGIATGTMFQAGADTTVSTLHTFFLAMMANPEAQKKAQEEIDRVIPAGHLPDLSDYDSLPYVSAIVKETFRWQPALPICVPHRSDKEDVYRGYRIPAGSVVLANIWYIISAMLHDESVYPEPFSFKPERFLTPDGKLNPNVQDPTCAFFGFGKRICPGRHMAQASVWNVMSSVLAVFNIEKPVRNPDGSVIEPTYEYLPGFICHPAPFQCSIRPRSKEAERLIKDLSMSDD
ncbi:hypothetical protein PQX77_020693 [Marasmius sp. AFHP31]|nr:hypothetical protein PQX77_020693 [Marasmius sp. AFHP31]